MSRHTNRDHVHRPPDPSYGTPGQPPHSDNWGDDQFSGHERQVHHRNYAGKGPGGDGYAGVPPGEQGQYGMRRSGSEEPWYNDRDVGSHSASEHDSHYAQWRREHLNKLDTEYQDWKKESYGNFCKDFETWRRAQTAPGTNVGKPESDKSDDK